MTENEVGGANEGMLSFEGGFGGGPVVVGEGEDIDNYKLMEHPLHHHHHLHSPPPTASPPSSPPDQI